MTNPWRLFTTLSFVTKTMTLSEILILFELFEAQQYLQNKEADNYGSLSLYFCFGLYLYLQMY